MTIAAIIQPSIDVKRMEREVAAAHIALRDAETRAESSTKRAESDREDAGRRRVELGRLLVEARKAWPRSGPNSRGWGEFLARQGIGEDSAWEWMRLAGYVEKISRPDGDGRENSAPIPTRREVAAAIRSNITPPAAATGECTASPVADRHSAEPLRLELGSELARLHTKVLDMCRKWPNDARRQLARELRSIAETIEDASND